MTTLNNWSNYFWLRSTGFAFEEIEKLSISLDNKVLKEALFLEEEFSKLDEEKSEEYLNLKAKLEFIKSDFDKEYALLMIDNKAYFTSLLQDEAFKEALFLSNPDALLRIESLVKSGMNSINSKKRQRIKLAWNYLQRFYSKNDTVSFFGPITWGSFNNKNKENICEAINDGNWIKKRSVRYEYWLINSLTNTLSGLFKDKLPLQINSSCSFFENTLYFPLNKLKKLDSVQSKVFELLVKNKHLTYDLLVNTLVKSNYEATQIKKVLDLFIKKGIITQKLNIPIHTPKPLIEILNIIKEFNYENKDCLNKWINIVENLEQLRDDFEKANLEKRKIIINDIYALLEEHKLNQDRQKGNMYVGRYPIYEDCLRNLKVQMNEETSNKIQDELLVVMDLYTVLVQEVAKRLYKKYLLKWEELSVKTSSKKIDFLTYLNALQDSIDIDNITKELKEVIKKAWLEILSEYDNNIEIVLTKQSIKKLMNILSTSFEENLDSSFITKKIHSPDFMIASKSIEDINKGNYELVIGEVHPSVHTVSQPVAQAFCPYSDEIKKEIETFAKDGLTTLADSINTYQRSHIDWIDFEKLNRIILPSSVNDNSDNSIASGSCFIVNEDNKLKVKSTQSKINEDLLSVMPTQLQQICFALANDLIGKNINARLKIGNVILKRRSWIINGELLPKENKIIDNSQNFLLWQKWKNTNNMPRYIFVKNPSEQKPVFVDFNNPFSLELLSYLANKKEDMFITEMYPDPENLWLRDERGKFCSEFRTSYINNEGIK